MNFELDDDQQVIADLAEQIFSGQASAARITAAEAAGDFDRRLWVELGAAGLIGLCLPESVGGSGLGTVELALLCQVQGRHVAPAPLLSTVAAAMILAERGAATDVIGAAIAGHGVLSAALAETGVNDVLRPSLVAERVDGGWRLHGQRVNVPYGQHASVVVVPARANGEVALFAIDTSLDGVRATPISTTDRQPAAHLDLDVVVADAARCGDATTLVRLRDLLLVGGAATAVGLAEAAVAQTATYVSSRHQFGRPLATLQAVGQRAADAYITTEAMRSTMLSAAWKMAEHDAGRGPSATADVLIAAWWAAEGGQKVTLATQHLHGGMGSDVDYPIHRYYLWATQLANTLGTGSAHLAALGSMIAEEARP